jgi:hypothetical protein
MLYYNGNGTMIFLIDELLLQMIDRNRISGTNQEETIMGGRVPVSVVVAALMLIAQHVRAGNFADGNQLYRTAVRAVVSGLEQIAARAASSIGRFMVDGDGGGDGDGSGDSGDGSSDGNGTGAGDSTSDGESNDDDAPSAPSAPSAAEAVTADAPAVSVTEAPSDPTETVTAELADIESIATTSPRGGFDPVNGNLNGNDVGEVPVGASGVNPLPYLRLLNGSVIPPVVPNVIDIRITSYSIGVIEETNN